MGLVGSRLACVEGRSRSIGTLSSFEAIVPECGCSPSGCASTCRWRGSQLQESQRRGDSARALSVELSSRVIEPGSGSLVSNSRLGYADAYHHGSSACALTVE